MTPADSRHHRDSPDGFTLIELLTVIAIIGLLASLLVPVVGRVRTSAHRSSGIAQLRQIGLAFPLHAAEHRDLLPGPMVAGQGPVHNPDRPTQLATALGPYLGVEDRSVRRVLPIFVPPAYERQVPASGLPDGNAFVLFIRVRQNNSMLTPWGDNRPPARLPLRLAQLEGRSPAMIDADQQNPLVAGHPFANRTTPQPYHGERRLLLHFDASVSSVTPGELKTFLPPPPPGPPPP